MSTCIVKTLIKEKIKNLSCFNWSLKKYSAIFYLYVNGRIHSIRKKIGVNQFDHQIPEKHHQLKTKPIWQQK